jgi:phosphatidylserine/phosphatidylglycerophosphate/cardiolipin synthase-like enzyme
MKVFLTLLIGLLTLGAGGQVFADAKPEVYFSPKGGVTDVVVAELGKARSTVLVQAYSFTSAPIAKALVDAHKRGVKVRVILDSVPQPGPDRGCYGKVFLKSDKCC